MRRWFTRRRPLHSAPLVLALPVLAPRTWAARSTGNAPRPRAQGGSVHVAACTRRAASGRRKRYAASLAVSLAREAQERGGAPPRVCRSSPEESFTRVLAVSRDGGSPLSPLLRFPHPPEPREKLASSPVSSRFDGALICRRRPTGPPAGNAGMYAHEPTGTLAKAQA